MSSRQINKPTYPTNTSAMSKYSGMYTDSERMWLTISRYAGLFMIGGGIYAAITGVLSVVPIILLFVGGAIACAINVKITQRGIARRKAHMAKKKNSGKKRK